MSDFFADDKKAALPTEWQQWVDNFGSAEHMDEDTRNQYFSMEEAGSGSLQGTVAMVDVPKGDLEEGVA